MKNILALLFLVVLTGCQEEEAEYKFEPAPKTSIAEPLKVQFGNWKAQQAALVQGASQEVFIDRGKGYLTLGFQSPVPIYSAPPTSTERIQLAAELLHHCSSERGKDQLRWIADWAKGEKLTESIDFVRLLVRFETKPQGESNREVFSYEARYTYANGTCGRPVSLANKVYRKSGYIQFFH